jgi:hypothetical protein
MKHLLSGAAAAVLSVTIALGWTHNSAASQQAAASMPDASATSAAPPAHRHVHSHSHAAGHHATGSARSSGNTAANQLNQQELSRLQSGGTMPPPPEPAPAPTRGPQLQGPRLSSGR